MKHETLGMKHKARNRELLFLFQKVTLSEKSTEILRKFVFLNKFEKGQILRKIWICLNNFFIKPVKGANKKKKICPKKEQHTFKLCFFVFLKHFWGNSQRTSLFSQKDVYLRTVH